MTLIPVNNLFMGGGEGILLFCLWTRGETNEEMSKGMSPRVQEADLDSLFHFWRLLDDGAQVLMGWSLQNGEQ